MASSDILGPSVGNDFFAHHSRQIISCFINEHLSLGAGDPGPRSSLSLSSATQNPAGIFLANLLGCVSQPGPAASQGRSRYKVTKSKPVGILGAGAAGLYTALILQDLGLPFKIIEDRDRVGGRLYTHTFRTGISAPHNYFDVGAMRFPKTDFMARVFHLFNYPPLNTGGDLALKAKLRPYYFSCENALMSYNGETLRQSDVKPYSFRVRQVIHDTDPRPYIAAGVKNIANDVVRPFAEGLLEDLKHNTTTGWDNMMQFDQYSARAYMSTLYRPSSALKLPDKSLSVDVVNWMEAFNASTGAYDRGLSEAVLDAVAFGWKPPTDLLKETEWWCIDGGSFQIADTMHKYLQKHGVSVDFSKRVTSIKAVKDSSDVTASVDVTLNSFETQSFSHVISTIPLPVLRTIDLTEAGLTPMQSNALKQLNYGLSTKIGMQFRTAWWTTGKDLNGRTLNIVGGQTYTDSPLRTVVYPSYGDVQAGKTTTLIASYCWTEDAGRLTALIVRDQKRLEEITLRELARIHNVTVDFLRNELVDMFAWSWSADEYTMGAYAAFGPGKFQNVFTSLTNPAVDGRLHFAGEAISTRHAWVEGALDSAWRAVFEILLEIGDGKLLKKFLNNWGVNAEWFSEPAKGSTLPIKLPVSQVPRGKFELPEEGKVDVEGLLKNSLLVKHIAITHPELVNM